MIQLVENKYYQYIYIKFEQIYYLCLTIDECNLLIINDFLEQLKAFYCKLKKDTIIYWLKKKKK